MKVAYYRITDDCIACGLCMDECPLEAIEEEEGRDKYVIIKDKCDGCGDCLKVCPVGAFVKEEVEED